MGDEHSRPVSRRNPHPDQDVHLLPRPLVPWLAMEWGDLVFNGRQDQTTSDIKRSGFRQPVADA